MCLFTEGVGKYPIFIQNTSIHWCHVLSGGGVPQFQMEDIPARLGRGYPFSQDWMGVPPSPTSTWMGYPLAGLDRVPPIKQNSRARICYVAGGIPLAFTQQDFLVHAAGLSCSKYVFSKCTKRVN